ncbi:MAG: hypothetical protein KDD47_20715, partial [Acidobacteria bacterium]|nr:hypothetical protein [Acidobacteriota bacterium]
PWILAVIGFAATLTPWTLRNYRSLTEVNLRFAAGMSEPLPTFVPLTLYGPLNLALANHGEADGTFSRDLMTSHQASGQLSVTDAQHLEFLLHGDRMAWEFIRGEPDAFGRLVLKKWKLYFGSTRLGWSQWDFPGGLSGVRRPIDVFVPYSSGAMSWILPAALLGALFCLWRPGPTRRWGLLVAVLTGSSLLVVALFFGFARQGLLMMPFWLSLAAFALVRLASAVTTRFGRGPIVDEPSRRLLTVLGCLALILLLLEAWGSTLDRKYHWTGTQLPGKRTLNPELTVYIRPLPSGS